MIRVGVIGCGGIGMAHINAYKQIPDVKLTACVDVDIQKARQAADSCHALAATDIGEIEGKVDAVSITTFPMNHFEICRSALNMELHVFCEKPLTMDTPQAQELVALAHEKQRMLMVGFKMRFEPIFVAARRNLSRIGKLLAISSTKLQPFSPRPHDWRPQVGAMYELSIHEIDLIQWITGRTPVSVTAQSFGRRFNWPREDSFAMTVQYEGNVTCQYLGMYASNAAFCFRDLTLTFFGENGYMRVERPDRIIMHLDQYTVENINTEGVNAFKEELTHFRDAIQGKTENSLGGEFGLSATRIIELARVSFAEQKEVRLS